MKPSPLVIVFGVMFSLAVLLGVSGYFLCLINEKPIATLLFLLCLFFANGWRIITSDLNKLKTYTDRTVALIKERVGRAVLEDTSDGEFLEYKFLLHLEFTIDGIEYSQRYRVDDLYYSYYRAGDRIEIGYVPGDLRFIIFNGSPYGHIDPDPDEFIINKITRKAILFLLIFVKNKVRKMKVGIEVCKVLGALSLLLALLFAFVF